MVRHLLVRGANVNTPDFYGQTALHFAAEFGRAEVADVLISAGEVPGDRFQQRKNITLCHNGLYSPKCNTQQMSLPPKHLVLPDTATDFTVSTSKYTTCFII